LAAVPRPAFIPEDVVRLVMLAIAIVLPAVLGGVTLLLFEPEDRPKGMGLATQVLRGYPLAPTLAVTLVVLAAAGTVRKLDSLVHRREDAHIAIVVRPGRYDALVDTLEKTLRENDLVDHRGKGSTVLVVPARLLAKIAGRGIGRYVPDKLEVLQGPELKVSVYPADLALSGTKDTVARSRALVAREIPSHDAWFTTARESQEVEDRMAALEKADPATRAAALPELDRKLLDLVIDQDTFEVLYRRRLQLAVPAELDVHDAAEADAPTPKEAADIAAPPPAGILGSRVSLGDAIGLSLAALAALDLLFAARMGRRRTDR
ncbi:MAG TPA: hypothetical protein VHL56_06670, partial [Candidatus Limnocylindrales bacterium]|nr:hypothetical protein [Candidatus Limnocylindrales bacterium]